MTRNYTFLFASVSCLTLIFSTFLSAKAQTGNVGINTTNPSAHLDIYGANTRIQLTDTVSGNTATISRYTNRLEISPSDIFQVSIGGVAVPTFIALQNGYIGMGTRTPIYPLHLQTPGGVDSWGFMHTNGNVFLGSFIYNSGIAELGTRSNHPLYLFTNNSDNPPAITIEKNGVNVGFGNINPLNQIQIGNPPGFSGNALAIGNGMDGMAFDQLSTASTWYSSSNFELLSSSGIGGSLGIGITPNLTTKLSLAATDLGTGIYISGNARTALNADNGSIQLTNGNIYVDNGFIAIGTSSPQSPIDVETSFNYDPGSWNYFRNSGGFLGDPEQESIHASGDVVANEYAAFSDKRIKNIIGISNSENDLLTLNRIQITDYRMKDKLKYGDQLFKKVIAQDLEQVYPQVITKHRDFIPNVYQMSNAVKKTDRGYLIAFDSAHHISPKASRLKMQLAGEKIMNKYEILSVPSENTVEIKADKLNSVRVFVYGEEVDDFRTVDYEGLSTLNISATQELSKLVTRQQQQINALQKELDELKEKMTK